MVIITVDPSTTSVTDGHGYNEEIELPDSNSNGETVGRDAKDPKTRIKGRLCDIISVRTTLSPRL